MVYVVVVVGVTTILDVVCPPVAHVYDVAPEADNVLELPEQMLVLATATVGCVATVTLTVFVLVQFDVVPVTVYIVKDDGETDIVFVTGPVFQL